MIKRPVVSPGHSRHKVRARKDKKVFSKTADRTHYINSSCSVMRGGIRL